MPRSSQSLARMKVGVPKETAPGERRVALVPDVAGGSSRPGSRSLVERGAGEAAGFLDAAYAEAGARVVDAAEIDAQADAIVRVTKPSAREIARAREGRRADRVPAATDRPEASSACSPSAASSPSRWSRSRASRARSRWTRSRRRATVSGYKAALIAADRLPRFFPMLMTAAGTVRPGEGARARRRCRRAAGDRDGANRLGAVVSGFDVRPAVRGAGREPRRDVPRPGRARRGDRGRLRAGADAGAAGAAAEGARGAHPRLRRR